MNQTKIQSRQIEGKNIMIVEIFGYLDEANVDDVADDFYKILEGAESGSNFIFDFKEVDFMNSKAIGYFLDFYRKISEKQGKMALARLAENVLDILELVGLTKIIGVHFTLEEAEKALTEE